MSKNSVSSANLGQEQWLKRYYYTRALFSVLWVASAFTLGQHFSTIGAVLLVIYPAWDALANYIDASRSGGLGHNRIQTTNIIVSVLTTLAVLVALSISRNWVIGVFGVWAILSGLLQLGVAVGRWKSYGAQWTMILSGAQSSLAGGFFILQAQMPVPPSIVNIAGYSAVGAFYFLVSALWLTVSQRRLKAA
jgi:hypothetical protein